MEEDVDTSPGGDYYTSPSSPTSSSRNWTEDMEGGGAGGGVETAFRSGLRGGDYVFRQALLACQGAGSGPGSVRPPGNCSHAAARSWKSSPGSSSRSFLVPLRPARVEGASPTPDCPALCPSGTSFVRFLIYRIDSNDSDQQGVSSRRRL